MKIFIPFIALMLLLSACSKKSYLERQDEDKALLDAIKQLNKDDLDDKASYALPILYEKIKSTRLRNISNATNSRDLPRWDKIVNNYERLQDAYVAITGSPAARKLVVAEDYSQVLNDQKQQAAEEYYTSAENYLQKSGRDNAKKAFSHFKKANEFVPGMKDAAAKMDEAYTRAVIDVVINPVEDNSFFSNNSWGIWGRNYSNEYFQQTLLRELNNQGKNFPAKFYTDWEAQRNQLNANWVINLRLRNMDIPQPFTNMYTRNASNRVQIGTDTAGKPVYQTVRATLYITRMSFTARSELEVQIRDIMENKNIGLRSFRDEYRWEEEQATYRGDSRALSSRDWQLINRTNFNTPRQEDILNELYRRIYPSVKNYIVQSTRW